MSAKSSPLKILPLGGLGEIGLNCMVFEDNDEILVVDCGLMFSDLQMLGVEFVIPDMSYLKENKHKIKGYLITHAHEDHIGALPFALKNHPAPVYCTRFAQKLIEVKLEEYGLKKSVEIRNFEYGKTVEFEHFKVTPTPVNHSIVEALALLIDTRFGKIVFTGDFKIDTSPFYGKPMDLAPFSKAGKDGVLLLMSDSTNVERDGHSISEKTIYDKFEEIFKTTKGLTIVAVFASNIARIGQVFELAEKFGKKIGLMGRSMDQNVRLAFESGYLKNMRNVLIAVDEIHKYDRKEIILLSTGSQGEFRSALVRIANNEHRDVKLVADDLVVISSKFIPGNEKAIGRMINSLFKLGADVLYDAVADIHVSGHANAQELAKMIKATQPKFFIPVHGEYRHLVRHKKLALTNGVDPRNALIAVNGDILEIDDKSLAITGHVEENRIFIEGHGGNDVSKVIIKDRRKVAETGVVFSVLIRNSISGKIIAGPDLITKGLLDENHDPDLIEDAKSTVLAIVKEHQRNPDFDNADIQEDIRIGLRRYFHAKIGIKPVVLPILIDV